MTDNQMDGSTRIRTPAEIMADARAERDRLLGQNQAGFAEIARMGAQIDPAALVNLRIDTLAQMVFGGADTAGFIEFQIRFERQVSEDLERIRADVRKSRLAAGVGPAMQQMTQAGRLLGPDGKPLR